MNQPLPPLLRENALVVQQTKSLMKNDFSIDDAAGNHVATVVTTGSTSSRFFTGARQFEVVDSQGTHVMNIQDPFELGLSRFEVTYPNGDHLATVQNRFSFFKIHLTLTAETGPVLEIDGDLLGMSFHVTRDGQPVATIDRTWAGISKAIRGHSRYMLNIDPSVPASERLPLIAGLLSLDLVRMKKRQRS